MDKNRHDMIPGGGEVLIYRTDDGAVKLDVRLINETIWMTQSDMAQLFQCSSDNISLHLKNIYAEGELMESATAEEFSEVRKEGARTDVTISKNYLHEREIEELNRIVTMWLDFSEDQAKRRRQIFMREWEQKLDDFLRFNDREILPHAGSITKKDADDFARTQYEQFELIRRRHKERLAEKDYMTQLNEAAKYFPNSEWEKDK